MRTKGMLGMQVSGRYRMMPRIMGPEWMASYAHSNKALTKRGSRATVRPHV